MLHFHLLSHLFLIYWFVFLKMNKIALFFKRPTFHVPPPLSANVLKIFGVKMDVFET